MYTYTDLAHPLESWTHFDIVLNSAYALLTMPVTYKPTNISNSPIIRLSGTSAYNIYIKVDTIGCESFAIFAQLISSRFPVSSFEVCSWSTRRVQRPVSVSRFRPSVVLRTLFFTAFLFRTTIVIEGEGIGAKSVRFPHRCYVCPTRSRKWWVRTQGHVYLNVYTDTAGSSNVTLPQ